MINKLVDSARQIPVLDTLEIQLLKQMNKRSRVANIAMFHTGRCGSTVLGDILDQHHDFYWASEIFENMTDRYKWLSGRKDKVQSCIERSMYTRECKFYGFETKFLPELHLRSDCINMSLDNYVKLVCRLGFSHFIILLRRNYLRRAVSAAVGRKTNEWHRQSDVNSPTQVKIDINNFTTGNRSKPILELFNTIDESYRLLEKLLENANYLKLVYEEDIMENPMIACQKVARFLGIDVAEFNVEVRFKRTNPFVLSEMILNYDEVASHLKSTKYEWMLND